MKPSTRLCFMTVFMALFMCHEHFHCDSRLIAAFRHVIVLLRNLFMKFRLFGDLETVSTIGKGIMNVSLFPPL